MSISLLFISVSKSTPLNGTYTKGPSGDYTTITLAFTDATVQGISGPVVFEVMNGTYNENLAITSIPGTSAINTVTLTSQSGDPNDVTVSIASINSKYIAIDQISVDDIIKLVSSNISISNNKFTSGGLFKSGVAIIDSTSITGNDIVGNIDFQGISFN